MKSDLIDTEKVSQLFSKSNLQIHEVLNIIEVLHARIKRLETSYAELLKSVKESS